MRNLFCLKLFKRCYAPVLRMACPSEGDHLVNERIISYYCLSVILFTVGVYPACTGQIPLRPLQRTVRILLECILVIMGVYLRDSFCIPKRDSIFLNIRSN